MWDSTIFLVESNDTLYGHDAKFLGEVEKLSVTVVDEILNHLKTLTEGFEVNILVVFSSRGMGTNWQPPR